MQDDDAEMPTWPKAETAKPEVNSRDVIQSNVGINCTSLSVITRDVWTRFRTELKKQTTIMAERGKFTYRQNPRWRRPLYRISKNVNIFGQDEDISTKFMDRSVRITAILRWSSEQKLKPEVNSRDVIRLSAYMYLIALLTNARIGCRFSVAVTRSGWWTYSY